MSREEIEVKVKEIVAEKAECEISEVNDQTNLEETLGMDSLDRVELLMEIEKEFGITIPDDDADKVITTKDCVDLVEKVTTTMKKEDYIERKKSLQQQQQELDEEYIKTNITYPVGTKVRVTDHRGKSRIGKVTNNIIYDNNVVPYVNMITNSGEVSSRRIFVYPGDKVESIDE